MYVHVYLYNIYIYIFPHTHSRRPNLSLLLQHHYHTTTAREPNIQFFLPEIVEPTRSPIDPPPLPSPQTIHTPSPLFSLPSVSLSLLRKISGGKGGAVLNTRDSCFCMPRTCHARASHTWRHLTVRNDNKNRHPTTTQYPTAVQLTPRLTNQPCPIEINHVRSIDWLSTRQGTRRYSKMGGWMY